MSLGLSAFRLLVVVVAAAASLQPARATPDPNAAQAVTQVTAPEPMPPGESGADRVVKAWVQRPDLANSVVGVEVMELPSGRVLSSHNGNRRFTPASTAKVFTCACAYQNLGGDFRYRTRLLAYGPIKHGRLEGDLVLSASQDPTFESDDLRRLFSSLTARGVKYVEGRLLDLPVGGGKDRFSPAWLAEDWGQDWMPVSSSLVIDHNLAPGRDPGRGLKASPVPPSALGNAMYSSLIDLDFTPGWVFLDEAANMVRVIRSGTPSVSGAPGQFIVGNPSAYNLKVALTIARQMGLHLSERVNRFDPQLAAEVVAEHESKPLSKIVEITLHESDNLYAQQLIRTLGLKRPGGREGRETSLEERGLDVLYDWLAGIGVNRREVVLLDGCGLSRKNCVSPHALNLVLKHVAGPSGAGPFLDLLRADGPSKYQAGSYQFKTGAMDSVRSISGVLKTAGDRHTLAVTVIVNGHTPSVRDVRVALSALTGQLRALTTLGPPLPEPKPSAPKRAAGKKRTKSAGSGTRRSRSRLRHHRRT